jgi:ATP-dependent Clp protease ATP-binding subunit ClpB
VDLQIARLGKLLADRKIAISLDEQARTWLSNQGYDPAYGARPLKRVIQRNVQDPLAEAILSGTVKDGEPVRITVSGGKLAFNGREVTARAA